MFQGIIAPNQNTRVKIRFGQLMFSSSHVAASKNKDGIKKNFHSVTENLGSVFRKNKINI